MEKSGNLGTLFLDFFLQKFRNFREKKIGQEIRRNSGEYQIWSTNSEIRFRKDWEKFREKKIRNKSEDHPEELGRNPKKGLTKYFAKIRRKVWKNSEGTLEILNEIRKSGKKFGNLENL